MAMCKISTALTITRRMRPARVFAMISVLACSLVSGQPTKNVDLSQASLEDLMNMQVTSVSKKEQQLSKTGAAIYVITQEDIHRSGATNIPDVLRMAPGVDVARIDANRWAVSIRGFNDQHANKVLVLVDGRSVYSPSFSGVFWDMLDVPLEDIERIEIIRGPGGTVWGANAVNGVINIITMSSAATQGGLVSAGGGNQDRADTLVQYGSPIGAHGSYRVFGRYFDTANSVFPNAQQAADGWQAGHAGFRSDWTLSPRDTFMVQGDFERTSESQTITTLVRNQLPLMQTFNDPVRDTLGDALGRWSHTLSGGSQMSLQVYDSYSSHLDLGFVDMQNTVDIDFQHHLSLGSRNDLVWGLGTRAIDSNYGQGYAFQILPHHRLDGLYSAFVQDELKLTTSLSLTVGSKFEHNAFTGFEFQPSAQLVWTPSNRQTVWASVSRALREPSALDAGFIDETAAFPVGRTFGVVAIVGNPNIASEELRDLEAGYRIMPVKQVSFDVTGFESNYRNLESSIAEAPYFDAQNGTPYLVLPNMVVNTGRLRSYGAEFFANWQAADHWRISPGYSYLHLDQVGNAGLNPEPGTSPNHQFQVRSQADLPHHLEWDNTVGYVSKLSVGTVPAYVRFDTRLGWRTGESVEWSVVGQNLLTPRHAEFSNTVYPADFTLVERSFFGKVTFRF